MMNWCGILTAMQNRFTRQWKTGNDKTNNRQDPVLLVMKTQQITRGPMQPEGTTTTTTWGLEIT